MVMSNSKFDSDRQAVGKNRGYLTDLFLEDELTDPAIVATGPMSFDDIPIPRYGEFEYIRLSEMEE